MFSRVDIIVFGATGYTGKHVVKKLHEISTKDKSTITWGIAGRSLQKLQQLLLELQCNTVPIIIADSQDKNSLVIMASKTRLVINCAGPYKYHGEPVVRACIRQKCHYIDISAEPYFTERIHLLYNKEAAIEKVFVVPACGMESVVPEMGLIFLQKRFHGTLNSVECYLEVLPENGTFGSEPLANLTTLETLLYNFNDLKKLEKMRTQLYRQLPKLEPKLALKRLPHKMPISKTYATPFLSAESSLMKLSQHYFHKKDQSRPVQIHTYVATSRFLYIFVLFVAFVILPVIAKFRFFVELILKFPKIISGGFCSGDISEGKSQKVKYVTTLYGRGWKNKNVDVLYAEKEDGWIAARATGYDAYEITAICTVASAIVLLDNSQKLPEMGGVYTPAPFFINTNLLKVLQENGIKFELAGHGDI